MPSPDRCHTLRQVLGDSVALVDSAEETAKSVQQLFQQQGLVNPENGGQKTFFVTDVPTRFERVGAAFLGNKLERVEQIQIG